MKFFIARKSGTIISVQPTDEANVYQEIGGGERIKLTDKNRLFVGDRAFETATKWVEGAKVWSVGRKTEEGVYHVVRTDGYETNGVFKSIDDAASFCDARNKL